jgi:hypothetical protein
MALPHWRPASIRRGFHDTGLLLARFNLKVCEIRKFRLGVYEFKRSDSLILRCRRNVYLDITGEESWGTWWVRRFLMLSNNSSKSLCRGNFGFDNSWFGIKEAWVEDETMESEPCDQKRRVSFVASLWQKTRPNSLSLCARDFSICRPNDRLSIYRKRSHWLHQFLKSRKSIKARWPVHRFKRFDYLIDLQVGTERFSY